jgi:TRAP-type C4-dicarboxylate transport system permease small subunit
MRLMERTRLIGGLFRGVTALACLIIIAMAAIIVGNVVMHGTSRFSWEFLSQAPRLGMT